MTLYLFKKSRSKQVLESNTRNAQGRIFFGGEFSEEKIYTEEYGSVREYTVEMYAGEFSSWEFSEGKFPAVEFNEGGFSERKFFAGELFRRRFINVDGLLVLGRRII